MTDGPYQAVSARSAVKWSQVVRAQAGLRTRRLAWLPGGATMTARVA
jgi:hypothetical protein